MIKNVALRNTSMNSIFLQVLAIQDNSKPPITEGKAGKEIPRSSPFSNSTKYARTKFLGGDMLLLTITSLSPLHFTCKRFILLV